MKAMAGIVESRANGGLSRMLAMPQPAANLVVSAYRFVALDDLPALRQRLFDSAAAVGLKGTVLLAEEGINIALAGPAA